MATYTAFVCFMWKGGSGVRISIWFDTKFLDFTCSYYVQQLYSHNKGTHVLPLTMDKKAVSGQEGQDGLFASAVWDKDEKACIVKIAKDFA